MSPRPRPEEHVPTTNEIERIMDLEVDDDGIEGFDANEDELESFGEFDPMQALGQLMVTQEGETIPDVLSGIRKSLETLTKVLHKMSKQLESK